MEKLTELAEELKKYDSFDHDKIKEKYDDLAKKYDEVLLTVGYPDPKKCAEVVESLGVEKSAEIFDMGCGTGLVGMFLKEKGYTNISGVDVSRGMLDSAEQKSAYTSLEELELGGSRDKFPEKYRGKFDVITAAGILAEGHLGPELFEEMVLSLKQDGYAVFTTREEYLTKRSYQPKMDELVEKGEWEFVSKEEFMRYNSIGEGVGRFKPTPVLVFVYKKL